MRYPDFSEAACRGLDINFFYTSDYVQQGKHAEYPDIEMVRKMCSGCPVNTECLTWALEHENHGLWAGTTAHERNNLRKKLNITWKNPLIEAGIWSGKN